MDKETAVVIFNATKRNIFVDLEIPLFISANDLVIALNEAFDLKIKPKSDYPLKTLYPRAFQTGQNHLIYYDFTTVE